MRPQYLVSFLLVVAVRALFTGGMPHLEAPRWLYLAKYGWRDADKRCRREICSSFPLVDTTQIKNGSLQAFSRYHRSKSAYLPFERHTEKRNHEKSAHTLKILPPPRPFCNRCGF